MPDLNEEEQSDAEEELGEEKKDAVEKKEKEGMADEAARKVVENIPYGVGVAVKAGKMAGFDVYPVLKKCILYGVVPLLIFIFVIIIFGGYFLIMNLLESLRVWWILK